MQERSGHKNERREDGTMAKDHGAADIQGESIQMTDDAGEVIADSDSSLSAYDGVEMEARTRAAEEQVRKIQSRYEEMKREMQRQIDETRERLNRSADERALGSKTEFVAALLPAFDNLQRSLEAARGSGSVEALLDGLERTVQGFESALAAIGVEPVKSVGEHFDPEKHEAVDTVEIRGDNDAVVTREYSRGYKLGDRLLRPARVQVGRAGNA
jgi:molecular chaperone GrpE